MYTVLVIDFSDDQCKETTYADLLQAYRVAMEFVENDEHLIRFSKERIYKNVRLYRGESPFFLVAQSKCRLVKIKKLKDPDSRHRFTEAARKARWGGMKLQVKR